MIKVTIKQDTVVEPYNDADYYKVNNVERTYRFLGIVIYKRIFNSKAELIKDSNKKQAGF